MPAIITKGAISAQGFGYAGAAATAGAYIEDVFSTYLYDGNGSTQTITNGVDLSGKGGLVWMKSRSASTNHALYDTARGATFDLSSNTTAAQTTESTGLTSFGSTGFSIGALAKINTSAATYTSWTFRKQAKFFDIVTYTGTGANRTISHNLGSTPGCIIVKRTDTTGNWQVYHNGLTSAAYSIQLNLSDAQASAPTVWNSTAPTSSVFSVGTDATVNASGGTYVAYLFASNAGGFGATGTDNVITCGTFTTDASLGNATVNLGYEPQWFLFKNLNSSDLWRLVDNMRGWPVGSSASVLCPNSTLTEQSQTAGNPTATGVNVTGASVSSTYIYIAIRRGPMKTPTSGTSVFSPQLGTITNGSSGPMLSTGFNVDFDLCATRNYVGTYDWFDTDRLRGGGNSVSNARGAIMFTPLTAAETRSYYGSVNDYSNAIRADSALTAWDGTTNLTFVDYCFGRAPGFFDEVCYTGTGANTTQNHNLGVVPELMIVKGRSGATAWQVYSNALVNTEYLVLNTTAAKATGATRWNSTTPTSTVFSLGTATEVNTSAATYVAYLFATCTGVSKVGSYSGTGATQTIDCGFTGGARFVLIKRTDSTGDWYVWDTARGMVSGTDPSILLNSNAAEVNANSVYTTGAGFQIVSTVAGINASGGSYIYLAIA